MTAVDVDALEAARAAATASYLKLTAEYWRDGDWTTWDWREHADDLLALLNMRSLLAEVREGRALREAVLRFVLASDDGTEYEHQHPVGEGEPECPACWADGLRAVVAATDGTP